MNLRLSVLLISACCVLGVLLNREQQRGAFERFDREHRRFLADNLSTAGNRVPRKAEPAVTLLRFDDTDLPQAQRSFTAWPPPAGEWQSMLQTLASYTPKAPAISIPMVLENPPQGLLDAAAGMSGLSVTPMAALAPGAELADLPAGLPVLKDVKGNVSAIPEFNALATVPGLQARLGVADIDMGQHISIAGEWAKVPLLARAGERVVPSLILRALLAWENIPPDQVTVNLGFAIRCADKFNIPVESDGSFRLYLPLAPDVPSFDGSMLLFSKEDLEQRGVGRDIMPHLISLKDRIAWLGVDDLAARKLYQLPDKTPVSRSGLAVRTIAAIQSGQFTHPMEPRHQYSLQLVTGGLALWLIHWRRRNLWKGILAAAILLLALSLIAFQNSQTWVPLVTPLAFLGTAFFLGMIVPRGQE